MKIREWSVWGGRGEGKESGGGGGGTKSRKKI